MTSCALDQGPPEEGSFASGSSTGTISATDDALDQVTYTVPDSSCPRGWTGLVVTTDGDGGVGDLDDVVACTDARGQRTYLENNSRAVWLLSAATVTRSITVRERPGLGEQSFVRIVRATRGQEAMAPGSAITAKVPPDEMRWTPDLPLTFGWEGHALTVARLQAIDGLFAIDALERQNEAGNALVACTLAVHRAASEVGDLADADAAKVVLAGLGSETCRKAASAALVSKELARVRSETQRLKVLTANLSAAAASSQALPKGAQLLSR
ncbi:MAG: hypothetical protein ABWX73_04655 [Marmoricola sp.]